MNWFIGVDKITILGDKVFILNLLDYYDVEYYRLKSLDNGVEFSLLCTNTPKLKRIPFGSDVVLKIEKKGSLARKLLSIIKRPGLVVSAIVFTVCMLFFGSFVFDIKVNGNYRLSEKFVLDALKDHNFFIGSYIPNKDLHKISNEICLEYGDVSWMFINMMGNVAYVDIREYTGGEKQEEQFEEDSMTDLVATKDGIIYRFEVESGIAKISIGQTALKGEILVSGCEKGEKADYYGRSVGKVFAKTYHTLDLFIPREIEIEQVSNKRIEEKWIEILGFRINLSKKGSNLGEGCDIIEESNKLTLPKGAELPISLNTRYSVSYETQRVTLSDKELADLADRKLAEEIEARLPFCEILSIERTDRNDISGIIINCSIYCIENIAKEVPCKLTTPENTPTAQP